MLRIQKFLIVILLLFLFNQTFSQTRTVDSLENLYNATQVDSIKVELLINILNFYLNKDTININGTIDRMLELVNSKKNGIPSRYIYAIGTILENYQNNYEGAIKVYELALEKAKSDKSKDYIEIESWLGYTLSKVGESEKGLQLMLDALQNAEKEKNNQELPRIYVLTAFVYKSIEQLDKAEYYFKKAEVTAREIKDNSTLHTALHEIGNIYLFRSDFENSLKYHKSALLIRESINEPTSLVYSYHDIGIDYKGLDSLDKALEFMYKAENLALKLNDKWMLFNVYSNIGGIYSRQKKNLQSLKFYDKAKRLADELKMKTTYENLYLNLYDFYKTQKKYENALENFELYVTYRDSITNEATKKNMDELDKKYETAKKDKKLVENQEYIRSQRIIIISVIVGLILVFIFMVIAIGLFRQKRSAYKILEYKNQEIFAQKEEIQMQADNLEKANIQISHQMEVIEKNHAQITASINYAKRIQEAMLPVTDIYEKNFKDNFVYYQPSDIVSGDFYWAEKINNKLVFAVADCTGHGVPGAMVSMLGMSLLNKVVIQSGSLSTSAILNDLRREIKAALKQKGEKFETKDGMDISLCILDRDKKKLQFSGAYSNAYLCRENQLIELKADSQPIGVFVKETEFTQTEVDIKNGDILYMFSDGFISQFHHTTKEKIKARRFKELLLEINTMSFVDQKNRLDAYLNEWKGHQHQIDDILVLGLKF